MLQPVQFGKITFDSQQGKITVTQQDPFKVTVDGVTRDLMTDSLSTLATTWKGSNLGVPAFDVGYARKAAMEVFNLFTGAHLRKKADSDWAPEMRQAARSVLKAIISHTDARYKKIDGATMEIQ